MSYIVEALIKKGYSVEQAKEMFLSGWEVIHELILANRLSEAEDAFFELFGLEIDYMLEAI